MYHLKVYIDLTPTIYFYQSTLNYLALIHNTHLKTATETALDSFKLAIQVHAFNTLPKAFNLMFDGFVRVVLPKVSVAVCALFERSVY